MGVGTCLILSAVEGACKCNYRSKSHRTCTVPSPQSQPSSWATLGRAWDDFFPPAYRLLASRVLGDLCSYPAPSVPHMHWNGGYRQHSCRATRPGILLALGHPERTVTSLSCLVSSLHPTARPTGTPAFLFFLEVKLTANATAPFRMRLMIRRHGRLRQMVTMPVRSTVAGTK